MPAITELTAIERAAQEVLADLVERAGGRMDGRVINPDHRIAPLIDLLEAWGRRHAARTGDGLRFNRPGLWHAFDELYPLRDTRRWIPLRGELVKHFQKRGWRRIGAPNASIFKIPDKVPEN